LREAKRCFAKDDFEGAMKTGVVCRKKRWIGGKDGYEVTDYEINSGLIDALNSVEKRAAIETGQEVDRSDINMRMGLADQAEILRKAFTLDELEAIEARIEAARNGSTVVEAPAVVVPKVQPVLDKTHAQGRPDVAATEAVDQAASEGRPDQAGNGRTGGGTEPGKLPRPSWRD
jgi:hypothetical protein